MNNDNFDSQICVTSYNRHILRKSQIFDVRQFFDVFFDVLTFFFTYINFLTFVKYLRVKLWGMDLFIYSS